MAKAIFSIGTNLGDRERNVHEAIDRLSAAFCASPLALSPVVNTKACGFDGPDFLNCIVSFEIAIDPIELLKKCKEIEAAMGRTDEAEYDGQGRRMYHDRVIDIDILTYGEYLIDTKELKIPHPQIETRDYIKELLLTLAAEKNNTGKS